MPRVMIRENETGGLLFYIAKKDSEEQVYSVELDSENEWGGTVTLTDGSCYYIDPIRPRPAFPTTLRFRRAD